MKKNILVALLTISSLTLGTTGYAATVGTHGTTKWQDIDNVLWSTDGTTWGNDDVQVGQTVKFQFKMDKNYLGTHHSDHLKAWIDWDLDGKFEENSASDPDEVLIYDFFQIWSENPRKLAGGDTTSIVWGDNDFRDDPHPKYSYLTDDANNLYGDLITFETTLTLTAAHIGTHDLLTRVTCSGSLNGHSNPWGKQWTTDRDTYDSKFNSLDFYVQGEAELRSFTVNAVPEPSTMLLFGSGLLGLAGLKRRKK